MKISPVIQLKLNSSIAYWFFYYYQSIKLISDEYHKVSDEIINIDVYAMFFSRWIASFGSFWEKLTKNGMDLIQTRNGYSYFKV